MSRQSELLATARTVQLGNYKPNPIVLASGSGRRVTDVDGRTYLDFIGGIAVTAVGHSHPTLTRAISEQAGRLIHVSNIVYNERSIELAAELVRRTGFARAFFCNSGAEANEAQLKLARYHHFSRGDVARVEYVSTYKSFHGRTMGSLAVTGQGKYQEGMQPLIGGVKFVDYGDASALRGAVNEKTAAVILEPIQAEGGIHVPSDDYLRAAREICDERGALLLFDEVQTGYGRTGRFLGQEWSGVRPDACSLAKAIGGGVPLGAMLVTERVADSLPPGTHGTTYGGNALSCAAGLAVLRIFDEEGLVRNAEMQGGVLRAGLESLVAKHPDVAVSARGRGLLQGLVLADTIDPAALLARFMDDGLLLTVVGGNVIRFVPALNVTAEEIAEALSIVDAVLADAPRKS